MSSKTTDILAVLFALAAILGSAAYFINDARRAQAVLDDMDRPAIEDGATIEIVAHRDGDRIVYEIKRKR